MATKSTIKRAPQAIDPNVFYDPNQTADGLNTTTRTLESWRAKGIGPEYVRLGGRLVIYKGSALLKYAEERTFRSTSEEAQHAA